VGGAVHHVEAFGLVGGGMQRFAHAEGDLGVAVSVALQQRSTVVGNLAQGIERVLHGQAEDGPAEVLPGDGPDAGEGGFKDEPARTVARGEFGGDAASHGAADDDEVGFRSAGPLGEPGAGGAGIGEEARFGIHLAAALAIAAIVKDQRGAAEPIAHQSENFDVVRDVSGSTVAVQHDGARVVVRQEPAVQRGAIGRAEVGIFDREVGFPVAVLGRRRAEPILDLIETQEHRLDERDDQCYQEQTDQHARPPGASTGHGRLRGGRSQYRHRSGIRKVFR